MVLASLQVTTTAGQTTAQVAQAVADTINGDPALAFAGITATASGSDLIVNTGVTSVAINDPGLSYGVAVPALSYPGLFLLTVLLFARGFMMARPRSPSLENGATRTVHMEPYSTNARAHL